MLGRVLALLSLLLLHCAPTTAPNAEPALPAGVPGAAIAASTTEGDLAANGTALPLSPTPSAPATSATPAPDRVDRPILPELAAPDDHELTLKAGAKVSGRHGLVTSVESEATRAGIEMLGQGGNAVDAAVAVGFALAVTHPSAGNLGGGGFLLVSADDVTEAVDFRETAPSSLTRARFDAMIEAGGRGQHAVGVPGTVAGLLLAHERHGRLERAVVMAPAIRLARGFRLGVRQAQSLVWNWRHLARDPAARTVFGTRTGKPKPAGARIQNPALAATLERIVEQGAAGFYAGETAADLVAATGGALSLTDLARYRAELREPLRVGYLGLLVETMPPPSAGGVAVALSLRMLERLQAYKQAHNSPASLHLMIEAWKRAHAERRMRVVDPDRLEASEARERVDAWTRGPSLLERYPVDPERATTAADMGGPLATRAEPEHTTHLSVVDAEGMAVSCTVTLSAGFGAGFMAKGSGVVLNNAVASFSVSGDNTPAAGRRTVSSMAPTLVRRDGQVVLVLGSPGGDTIPNTVVQVLRNVVDHGMSIEAAVRAPRIHHGYYPDEVRYERSRPVPLATRRALERLGHRWSTKGIPIGDANNILLLDGVAYGISDPREGGLALAAKPRNP